MRRRGWWVLAGWLVLAVPALAADAGGPDAAALGAIDGATAVPVAAEASRIGATSETPSLGRFLDHDGRLALPAGFSGSLDPDGFELVSKPGEPPRFTAKNAIDEPARWDPQFGQPNGCSLSVTSLAAFPDGRIVVGGRFTICGNEFVDNVAIWNPVGGQFEALGTGAANGVSDQVYALAIAGSDVYVGGRFTQAGGAAANFVARYNTTTQTWSSLGTSVANGVNSYVTALVIAGSDVYVGGNFTLAGGAAANNVARFNTTTETWSSLGAGAANGVSSPVGALAIAGSDVYVGGNFTLAGGAAANNVARFNTITQTWSSLGTAVANGVSSEVRALAIAGSDVYVGGDFTQAGGAPASRVARFSTTAQTWSSLGTGVSNGVSGSVYALAIAGNDVYVGGFFNQAGGAVASRVARFNTTTQTWSSLGTGAANGVNSFVYALAIAGSDVYIGGQFTQVGTATANRLARFNTTTETWSSLGAGVANGANNGVVAISIAGSDMYMGGFFTQVGTVAANRVARFNTTTETWSSLGAGAANGVNSPVYALAIAGSDVYVGGSFTLAGGAAANRVARFNTITQTWSSLGAGVADGVNSEVLALAIAGSDVYVGGFFTQAGGAAANRVARFNTITQTWSSLGAGAANGVNSPVNALAIAGSDVYVGGNFTQAGGAAANFVARYSTTTQTWYSLGIGTENGVSEQVNALAIVGSDVYVGGNFTQAGGVTANRVAHFSATTQTWSRLGVGAANGVSDEVFATSVNALAIVGSDVYVGGFFTQAGGATANRVARFNTTTQSWSSLGTGVANEAVAALTIECIDSTENPVTCDASSRARNIYLGGSFALAGPNVSQYIARYDARRATTSSIVASAGPTIIVNAQITFTGSVTTTGFPVQPGPVEFLDNGTVVPTCANVALVGGLDTRAASCTLSSLRVGAHNIVARYQPGDVDNVNFIGTSDPVAIDVLPPSFAYNLPSLPGATFNTAGYGSGTIAVSTAAETGVIGPVSFQVVDAGMLPPGLTASPQANGLVITGTPTQAGTFNFTVRATDNSSEAVGGPFSGDRPYTIVVARATQAITPITRVDGTPLDNGVAFADGDFAVQATASSGLPVAIDSTTPTVCQVGAPGSTVQPLQLGTCTLRARQAGNSNYEPATEVQRTFQVKATPDVIIDSAPNPSLLPVAAAAPDPVILTATVATPAGGAPTGTVRFLRAGNTIAGCAAQPVSGFAGVSTATCNTSSLVRGANTITAQYSGDALNVAAASNVHTHQLNVATAVGIAMITPSPCVVGEDCTVAVAVAASPAANGTPPGSVQVGTSVGGSCTVPLQSGGGSCGLTAITAGTGTVTATYLGSPPWLASPAATQGHPFVATVDELFANGFEPVVARDE